MCQEELLNIVQAGGPILTDLESGSEANQDENERLFFDEVHKDIPTPILSSKGAKKISRAKANSVPPDFTPRRSRRLALKQTPGGRRTEKSAEKVLMTKLGIIEQDDKFDAQARQAYIDIFERSLTGQEVEAIAKVIWETAGDQLHQREGTVGDGGSLSHRCFVAWISCGYAYNHNDNIISNSVEGLLKYLFLAKFKSCQVTSGWISHGGGVTGHP